jgi:hypothetical protein
MIIALPETCGGKLRETTVNIGPPLWLKTIVLAAAVVSGPFAALTLYMRVEDA